MPSSAPPAARGSRLPVLAAAGLLLAAAGLAWRWVDADLLGGRVPPGLPLLVVVAVLLLVLRRTVTLVLAGLLALLLLVQRLTGGYAVAVPLAVEVLGLLVGLVAAAAGVALAVRQHERRSPGQRRAQLADGLQVVLLLVLAPVCAEYLSAYDSSTGDPARLLGGLLVFTPLYGCPALLIREVARRAGLGWTGILLLGTGFGLVQAGLVDQSLFNDDYRQIEGWEALYRRTFVPGVGVSAVNALNFLGGHAVFSIAAPIALTEAVRPRRAARPWLSRPTLLLVTLAWVGAAALVAGDTLRTETFRASGAQLGGTALLILLLVVLASRSRPRPLRAGRPAPPLWLVGVVVLPLAVVSAVAPETWVGVALNVAAFGSAVALGLRLGGRPGWNGRHVAVAAAVPLLVRAALAFTYDPLVGEVAAVAKYGHNIVMALLVLSVAVLALRRQPDVFDPEARSVSSGA